MKKLLAIYAAVLFIAGVIFFTIAQLNIGKSEEPETYRWMRIFSIIVAILALVCVLFYRAS